MKQKENYQQLLETIKELFLSVYGDKKIKDLDKKQIYEVLEKINSSEFVLDYQE